MLYWSKINRKSIKYKWVVVMTFRFSSYCTSTLSLSKKKVIAHQKPNSCLWLTRVLWFIGFIPWIKTGANRTILFTVTNTHEYSTRNIIHKLWLLSHAILMFLVTYTVDNKIEFLFVFITTLKRRFNFCRQEWQNTIH